MGSAEGVDADTGVLECASHPSGETDGVGCVGVDADRSHRRTHHGAVHRLDLTLTDGSEHPGHHRVEIVEHGTGLRARHEVPIGGVGPIGEHLLGLLETDPLGLREEHRSGRTEDHQGGVVLDGGLDHGPRADAIVPAGVVQRAVRLHIGHLGSGHLREPIEGAELVEHEVAEFLEGDRHRASAESRQVRIRDLSPDPHRRPGRREAGSPDGARVPRVETTGHIRRGDRSEERLIVPE